MNRDKTEGTAKDLGGTAKEAAGDVTGDKSLKREGQADQTEGKLQKGIGKIKDALTGKK